MSIPYLYAETTPAHSCLKNIALILGASVIIALFATLSFPLPFTPIPVATQAHVILLLSSLLGSKRAFFAVLAFLFQGAIGLPVFAGGQGGLPILLGPKGGYLVGYLAAALITGFLIERRAERTPLYTFASMGVGNLGVYLFGLPWLACYVGWSSVLLLGMLPFLLVDLCKLVLASKILKKLNFFT